MADSTKTQDGTSPGCLAAMAIVVVIVFAIGGYIAYMAIGIAGYMEDDPSLHPSFPTFSVPAGGSASLSPGGAFGTDCESVRAGTAPPTTDASLMHCDLRGTDLSGMTLRSAHFDGANLSDAVLDRADLTGAVLGVANLSGTSFAGADLTGANLSYSNVWNADFTGAVLTGARFTDSAVTGAVWSDTTCPDGSNSDDHGATCMGYGISV
jgi:hypothetical protein